MLTLLVVGLLVLIVGRVLAARVFDRLWPRLTDPVLGATVVGTHALMAFAFAWLAYLAAASDPLHVAVSALFVVFGAWEAALALACGFVLAKPSAS